MRLVLTPLSYNYEEPTRKSQLDYEFTRKLERCFGALLFQIEPSSELSSELIQSLLAVNYDFIAMVIITGYGSQVTRGRGLLSWLKARVLLALAHWCLSQAGSSNSARGYDWALSGPRAPWNNGQKTLLRDTVRSKGLL
ncbi:hypothetical protein C8R47DRAFT_1059780 [Mycena vitilis]|nr:hypothetical protein C8R47DRAFT_1059780 [Mycena vitilis]